MGVAVPLGFGQATIPFLMVGDSEEMVTTVCYEPASGLNPTQQAQTIQNQLFAQGIFNASSFGNEWTIGPVRVVYEAFNGPQEGIATGTRVGTLPDSEEVPNNTAVLVQKRTLRGGRSGRGRMFWPVFYPNEDSISRTGHLQAAAITGWQDAMTNWRTGCASNGVPLFLCHSRLPDGSFPTIAPDEITSLLVQTQAATQRTRMRR